MGWGCLWLYYMIRLLPTLHPGQHLFGAWHDLGVRQEFYPADQQAELGVYSFDDATILAFQGCFGRLEACF